MLAARRVRGCAAAAAAWVSRWPPAGRRPPAAVEAALAAVVLAAGCLAAGAIGPGPASQRAAGPGAGRGVLASGAAAETRNAGRAIRGAWVARLSPPPLRVLAISAGRRPQRVSGAATIRVRFSARLAAGSPLPRLRPAVAGSWTRRGRVLVFTPAVPFQPATSLVIRVPGGRAGVRSAAGGLLASQAVTRLRVRGWSIRSLERYLAQLRYLPLSWSARPGGAWFRWRRGYPAALRRLWRAGRPGVILTGALMAFQADHGLPVDGVPTAGLRAAVFRAAARRRGSRPGYSYALASKAIPETLTVWHDGRVVSRGLANTGVRHSPTADGTFPVYLRYRAQVMRGRNPNGTRYKDPVRYVSYFHGGDAVHSFIRRYYGFPQSLGCVELPLGEARGVWRYLSYGTLVTVTG